MAEGKHYEIVRTDGELIAGPFNSRDAAEAFAACIAPIVAWRILPCAGQTTPTEGSIIDRVWHDQQ